MHDWPDDHEHTEDARARRRREEAAAEAWLRQEQIELRSVGIDIGSSTSHLTFSRLVLRRMGIALSSRYQVVEREIIYQSPILLTPYQDPVTIDTLQLGAFIHDTYRAIGLSREAIDTGAVIITGEAAKKENAEAILELFAEEAGRFVCATAGPQLEAIMAAHGSGAVARSREGGTILNVDIGGGTTKLAVCREGEVVDTAIINIGGRLVAHEGERITRLEEMGVRLGEATGLRLALGERLEKPARTAIVERMVDSLLELLEHRPLTPLTRSLMHTAPLSDRTPLTGLMFSGGVSEYIYGHTSDDHGDLGRQLGHAIRRRIAQHPLGALLVTPAEGIRATVIGAAQYTVQVSGSTIFCPQPGLLPLRNLPVLTVNLPSPLSTAGVAEAVARALNSHDAELLDGPLALALRWPFGPGYTGLRALGEGLIQALGDRQAPTVLAFDRDIARLAGRLLVEELGMDANLITVDEVELAAFDYIDVGEPLPPSGVVPLVIKSLVFRPQQGWKSS